MATLTRHPEVRIVPAERENGIEPGPRATLRLQATGILLGLLSIMVPVAILLFVYPLNSREYYWSGLQGRWVGETWWSYACVGIIASVGLGLAGMALAVRGVMRVTKGEGSHRIPGRVVIALLLAILTFTLLVVALLADAYMLLLFMFLGVHGL